MLVPEDIGYEELRDFFMDALPPDTRLFNEFHALIVRTGKGRRTLAEKGPLPGVEVFDDLGAFVSHLLSPAEGPAPG